MDIQEQERLSECFLAAISAHDPSTGAHCHRVGVLASEVGGQLGLSAKTCRVLYCAGLLHDIGKLAINPAVLNGENPLLPEEWREIRRHPSLGADLLIRFSTDLCPTADAVRSHHERVDGTGYPDELKGEEIPLTGRILAAVDVYDALTSARSYRLTPFTSTEAREYLVSNADAHFDAEVVEATLSVLSERETL